jgi:hypothetical protein
MEPKIPIKTACLYDAGKIESPLRCWAGKKIETLSPAQHKQKYVGLPVHEGS